MKKPFYKTKVGKFLTNNTVKNVIKGIPFGIGSMAGHILDEKLGRAEGEVLSPAGSIDHDTFIPDMVKLAFYILLALMVLLGWISMEQAEGAKGLVSP